MTENCPVEIERKFLVATLPHLHMPEPVLVRQGYLTAAEDTVEIRLRQKVDACFMTLKSGTGWQRSEYEIMIDRSQFDVLWPATDGRRVEKTRYPGRLGDQRVFELDVFSGVLAPLTLVEVEFTAVEAAAEFVPPTWFGMNVTDNKCFNNKSLAANGLPARPVQIGG